MFEVATETDLSRANRQPGRQRAGEVTKKKDLCQQVEPPPVFRGAFSPDFSLRGNPSQRDHDEDDESYVDRGIYQQRSSGSSSQSASTSRRARTASRILGDEQFEENDPRGNFFSDANRRARLIHEIELDRIEQVHRTERSSKLPALPQPIKDWKREKDWNRPVGLSREVPKTWKPFNCSTQCIYCKVRGTECQGAKDGLSNGCETCQRMKQECRFHQPESDVERHVTSLQHSVNQASYVIAEQRISIPFTNMSETVQEPQVPLRTQLIPPRTMETLHAFEDELHEPLIEQYNSHSIESTCNSTGSPFPQSATPTASFGSDLPQEARYPGTGDASGIELLEPSALSASMAEILLWTERVLSEKIAQVKREIDRETARARLKAARAKLKTTRDRHLTDTEDESNSTDTSEDSVKGRAPLEQQDGNLTQQINPDEVSRKLQHLSTSAEPSNSPSPSMHQSKRDSPLPLKDCLRHLLVLHDLLESKGELDQCKPTGYTNLTLKTETQQNDENQQNGISSKSKFIDTGYGLIRSERISQSGRPAMCLPEDDLPHDMFWPHNNFWKHWTHSLPNRDS